MFFRIFILLLQIIQLFSNKISGKSYVDHLIACLINVLYWTCVNNVDTKSLTFDTV